MTGSLFCTLGHSVRHNVQMPRELVWIDQPRFRGWGRSKCVWVFNSPGPPVGVTLTPMARNFMAERDKEFAAHTCANSQE
jgi:hypothetical protein